LQRLWAGNLSVRREDWIAAAEISRGRGGYHDDRAFGLALGKLALHAVFDPALRADHWYSRPISGFVRDARDSAVGEHSLGLAHAKARSHDESRATRIFRWSASHRATWAASVGAAGALALAASATGFERGEEFAARVLWRLGRERGFLEVEDRVSAAEG
jgi:hypothetical protein